MTKRIRLKQRFPNRELLVTQGVEVDTRDDYVSAQQTWVYRITANKVSGLFDELPGDDGDLAARSRRFLGAVIPRQATVRDCFYAFHGLQRLFTRRPHAYPFDPARPQIFSESIQWAFAFLHHTRNLI